jgi:D-alanyl-lipoteichoic acid acyltransferase DltB (MBOAT superfamily)
MGRQAFFGLWFVGGSARAANAPECEGLVLLMVFICLGWLGYDSELLARVSEVLGRVTGIKAFNTEAVAYISEAKVFISE